MTKKVARRKTPKQVAAPRGVPDRLRAKLRDNVAQAITLTIGLPVFEEVLEHLKEVGATLSVAEQQRFTESLEKQLRLLEQRRENGQILSGEGRAAQSKNRAASDRIIANLYRTVRPSFSPGGTGNAKAIKVVADRHQQRMGRDKPVVEKTIRNALKRCGVPCR